jgi:hypothetical protein
LEDLFKVLDADGVIDMETGAEDSPRSSCGTFPRAEEAAPNPFEEFRLLEACKKIVNHHNYISRKMWRSSLRYLSLFQPTAVALRPVVVTFWLPGKAI